MSLPISPRLKHWIASHGQPFLETFAWGMRVTGATRRAFARAPRDSFRILAYHQTPVIHAEAFRRQMEWLVSNRSVIALGRLVEMLEKGEDIPHGAVAITFDDGFSNNHEVAVPILRKLSLPACFFIATDFIDLADQGEEALRQWGERVYRFTRVAQPMSWDQVRGLARQGFGIGVHTRSHANLGRISEGDIHDEIAHAFEKISSEIGPGPRLFAYPYGKSAMAPPAARAIAMRSAPLRAAFSTERGWNTSSTSRDWLHRDSMEPAFSPRLLDAFLSGIFD